MYCPIARNRSGMETVRDSPIAPPRALRSPTDARSSSAARISQAFERLRQFVEGGEILNRGGHLVLVAVGDLADGSAEDFSRARLRQLLPHRRRFEERHRPDAVADQLHQLLAD